MQSMERTKRAALYAATACGFVVGAWRAIRMRAPKENPNPNAPMPAGLHREASGSDSTANLTLQARLAPARSVAKHQPPVWKRPYLLAKEAIKAWMDDYAPSMGAALSYYTVFSIAPLLLIVISVAGLAFGEDAARGHITAQLQGFLGEEGAVAIEGLLKSVSLQSRGLVGTIVGVVLLLVGATTVFAELQSALDRIWHAPERAKPKGLIGLLRARLLSFGLILGIGFLMIVSLVAGPAMSALGQWWAPVFEGREHVLEAVNFVVTLGVVIGVFAMIYKFMPSVPIGWRDVWVGAVVTAALFTIGKYLIGLYIGTSGVTTGFGAASSIVLLLVWVYYSAQIFLVGAEFTWVYAHRSGSKQAERDVLERGQGDV